MRRYLRHPANIPIRIGPAGQEAAQDHWTCNVGEYGIAFRAAREFAPGAAVHLSIPVVNPPFETDARVVWCHARPGGYELGVAFTNADESFRARMFEQICHIENYRKEVLENERRELTTEEAASEWISRFASRFPSAS